MILLRFVYYCYCRSKYCTMIKCVLCLNLTLTGESINIQYIQDDLSTITELIKEHFSFYDKILCHVTGTEVICNICLTRLKDFHQFFTTISGLYNVLGEVYILDTKTLQCEKEAELKSTQNEELNPLTRTTSTRISRTHLKRLTLMEPKTINPKKSKSNRVKEDSLVVTKKKSIKKGNKREAILQRERNIKTNLDNDRIVRENIDMSCPICQQQLDSFTDAHNHFQKLHNRNAYFVCCEKKLSYRKNALDHINWHLNPDSYKCSQCGKSYNSMKFLQNHLKNVHEPNKEFQCDLCVVRTATIQQLRNHMTSHTFSGPPEFECNFCHKKYVNEDKLKLHKKSNHSLNKYMCEFCSHVTKHKCTLEMHIKSAHESPNVLNRIKCDLCGHWLKDARSFRKHLRRHKDSLKEHLCPHCSKKFPYSDSLKNHVRYVHETPKTIMCRYCPKSFARPRDHKEHEATHTGENLHTCPFCPQAFNYAASMHAHKKRVHRDQYQQPTYLRDVI